MYLANYLSHFAEHLPRDGDTQLSLLKCHLLVEELLTEVIVRNTVRPEHVPQISFDSKVKFAQAFTMPSENDWIWNALKVLNQARNKLAHNLDTKAMEEKLEEFMGIVESVEGPPPADAFNGPIQRFQLSAFKVFMHTVHAVEMDASDIKIKVILGAA